MARSIEVTQPIGAGRPLRWCLQANLEYPANEQGAFASLS